MAGELVVGVTTLGSARRWNSMLAYRGDLSVVELVQVYIYPTPRLLIVVTHQLDLFQPAHLLFCKRADDESRAQKGRMTTMMVVMILVYVDQVIPSPTHSYTLGSSKTTS